MAKAKVTKEKTTKVQMRQRRKASLHRSAYPRLAFEVYQTCEDYKLNGQSNAIETPAFRRGFHETYFSLHSFTRL